MALTNSQYESIIRDYERTRDANRYLLESRKEQVYQTLPEYWDLEESVSSLSVSAAKAMLGGDEQAPGRLHENLLKIKQRQRELLLSAGFSADYLEPIYRCPQCKDTGYIMGPDNLKQKCSCFRKKEITILYSQSHIQDMVEKENFSTLSSAYYQGEDLQRFEAAVKLSKEFIKNFNQDYHNILFYGTVGTGKSFLSGCIAKALMQEGHSVIYFSASGLMDFLSRYALDYKSRDEYGEAYQDIFECDLLIIDDLGSEITNAASISRLFTCLNERFLRQKSIIISTNLSMPELRTRYSDRIFSRLYNNFVFCKMTGADIRTI